MIYSIWILLGIVLVPGEATPMVLGPLSFPTQEECVQNAQKMAVNGIEMQKANKIISFQFRCIPYAVPRTTRGSASNA